MSGRAPGHGDRWIRGLIRLYPKPFRERYGPEMLELTRRRIDGARPGLPRARRWVRVTADLAKGAALERVGSRPTMWPRHESRHDTIRGEGETMIETLRHDARSTLSRVIRTPWFSLAAVLIVALGIGANTAVFTVVNAVLLRPPPFEDPDRVVRVYQDSDDGEPSSTSFPAYRDMTAFADVFTAVSATSPENATWERDEGPRPATIDYVTSSQMDVVGLQPALGRWFDPAHDQVGAGYFAVVSHHTWQNRMGADPDVLGSVVRLNGRPVTLIGVGPEGYNGIGGPIVTDFWLSISSVEIGGSFRVANLDRREDHWYDVMARLAPGVTVEQAQAAMDALAQRLAETYPELNEGRDITVFRASDVRLHPEVDQAIVGVGGVVMGIAGIVLLLACSNLANLLLVQGISRSSEVAIRRALGATPTRVAGLFLGEAFVLASAGGGLGVGLAYWALARVDRLPSFAPQGELDLSMDGTVLLFTALLVLVSACFFGLAPALRSMRSDPARALGSETRSASPSRGATTLQGGLVAVQVAASVVLLVGATLLMRSLTNLQDVDPGFDPEGVAYLLTTTNVPGLADGDSGILLEQLREAVAAAPGVDGAALTTRPPVSFGGSTTTVVEGYEPPSGTGSVELDYAYVTDGYFDVLGLPVVEGRGFTPDDGPDGEAIVIVNETAANRFWGGEALGGRIRPQSAPGAWRRVVGVVADHTVEQLGEAPTPMIYYALGDGGVGRGYVVARTSTAADDLLPVLRSELRSVSAVLPVSQLGTMEDRLGDALRTPRLTTALLGSFALVALLLASLGIYSVVSFGVARRTAELGIRIALGAERGQLVVSAVLQTLVVVAVGVVAGVGLAALGVPLLGGMLFGIPALDPASFVVATLLLSVLAAAAAWIPARRAAQADPVEALRSR